MNPEILLLCIITLAFAELVVSCRYDQLRNCKGHDVLTDSKVMLIDPDNIDSKCEHYKSLFNCVTRYLGTCSLKSRMQWQPIQRQVTTLCTTSKSAYMETKTCWNDDMTYYIEDCNEDVRGEYDDRPCRAMDRYIQCLRESATDMCSKQAGQVLADLGTSYVTMIRETLQCNVTTTTGAPTTSTTTLTAASTTELIAKNKDVTDQTRVFSNLTDRVSVKEDEGEPEMGGEEGGDTTTRVNTEEPTSTTTATLTPLHTTASTTRQNTPRTQAVQYSSTASVTNILVFFVGFMWVVVKYC